jgi:hypothetical protein
MSDETFAALADAIQAHITDGRDDDQFLLTDWVVYSYSTSMTEVGVGAYQRASADMPGHTLLGLADRLRLNVIAELDEQGGDSP